MFHPPSSLLLASIATSPHTDFRISVLPRGSSPARSMAADLQDLICTFAERLRKSSYCTDSAAYCKRDKYIGSNGSYHIYHSISFLSGKLLISEKQPRPHLPHRRLWQSPPDHPASLRSTKLTPFTTRPFYIQAGMILFANMIMPPPFRCFASSAAKFSRIFQSPPAALLGWNWWSKYIAFLYGCMDTCAILGCRLYDFLILCL